jgi:toxin ParE1/3/4
MQLRWALRARLDLFDIADNYDRIDTAISDRLLAEIETAPLFLTEHPHAGALVSRSGLRKWRVRRTPFILLYRVSRTAVEVARVVHHATNWQADL